MKIKIFLLVTGITFGCGINLDSSKGSQMDSDFDDEYQTVNIPIVLEDLSRDGSVYLTSASAFSMDLEGCASGYSVTVTEADASINLYKYDEGCLLKLKSLVVGGITYTYNNSTSTDFTTWQSGDTAEFSDVSGFYNISLNVTSQLDDPISGTEPVAYGFSMAISGADESLASTDVGDSHSISVEDDPVPAVSIFESHLVGIDPSGSAEFNFSIECDAVIFRDSCDGVDMTGWSYALVEDVYGSVLTQQDLLAITYSSVSPGTVDSGIGSNGGILTPTLLGPAPFHSKPNMILVVKNFLSYTYFNVDMAPLSN